MRLLADENFSTKIASRLRSIGHDVASVAKAIPESQWKGKLVFVFEDASAESKAGKFFPWP